MVKLDFRVPEFTRVAWVSPIAREVWEPRIHAISEAWLDLEIESVKINLRRAALVFGLERVNKFNLANIEVSKNRYAVGNDREKLARAFADGDNDRIGKLLGTPECCRKFFDKTWGNGNVDTTWEMSGAGDNVNHVQVAGPVECNILGRWLGVRFVPHLPCSFNCNDSVIVARNFGLIWPKQELEWAKEILSWPMRWSSLHGVAIITLPILKVVTNTTPLSSDHIVDRDGPNYPDEGISGLDFPFRTVKQMTVHGTGNTWTDNGFPSFLYMWKAHQSILTALRGLTFRKVIDLGCGNGLLLEKIGAIDLTGIEQESVRCERARKRLVNATIICGNLHDPIHWHPPYDLALISANRLLEVSEEQRESLLQRLSEGTHHLLLYSYDNRSLSDLWKEFFTLDFSSAHDGTTVNLLRSKHA